MAGLGTRRRLPRRFARSPRTQTTQSLTGAAHPTHGRLDQGDALGSRRRSRLVGCAVPQAGAGVPGPGREGHHILGQCPLVLTAEGLWNQDGEGDQDPVGVGAPSLEPQVHGRGGEQGPGLAEFGRDPGVLGEPGVVGVGVFKERGFPPAWCCRPGRGCRGRCRSSPQQVSHTSRSSCRANGVDPQDRAGLPGGVLRGGWSGDGHVPPMEPSRTAPPRKRPRHRGGPGRRGTRPGRVPLPDRMRRSL